MANLQIQDAFEPYYSGRNAGGSVRTGNDGQLKTATQPEPNVSLRRGQFELASRRLAVLARRQGLREK